MPTPPLNALALAASVGLSPALAAQANVDVLRLGRQAATRGDAKFFTGEVFVDQRFAGSAPARLLGGLVSFSPGARTAWHTHPLGQTLFVVSGVGRVQMDGRPVQEIHPGDVVWIPAGARHWHGAATGIATGRRPRALRRWRAVVRIDRRGTALRGRTRRQCGVRPRHHLATR